jgi:hypothetical protein
MKNNLAIVVSSYDGACNMWNNFFKIFNYYWSDCKYNCYLINNFLRPEFNTFKIINTYEEKGWKNRILKGLSHIEEEYILFIFEDNFLGKKVENQEIENIMEYIKEKKIKFYQLGGVETRKLNNKTNKENVLPILENERYGINLQCAIWLKVELIKLIKNMKGKTPWDFEKYYLENLESKNFQIKEGYVYDKRDILNIQHGILHGKWVRKTVYFYKKKNIELDLCGYKIRSFYREKFKELQSILGKKLSLKIIRKLKKILKKLGFKFVSDF